MERASVGDRWAFGRPHQPFVTPRKRRWASVAAMTALLMALGSLALADVIETDGDVTTSGVQDLTFGTVCVDDSKTLSVDVWAKTSGGPGVNNNKWDNSAVLTATVGTPVTAPASTATGTSLTPTLPAAPETAPAAGTSAGNQIGLPANWLSLANNNDSAKVTGSVTINAGSTPGTVNGTIPYTLTGRGYEPPDKTLTNTLARNDNLSFSATISDTGACAPAPSDTTPPVITPNVAGTLGNNNWYVSDVLVTWSVVDNESAISSSSGCGSTTINTDTTGTTLTCTATSAGGTNIQSVTIKRDATDPTDVAFVGGGITDGGSYYFGFVPAGPTGCTANDVTSLLASCVVTGGGTSVGAHSYTATATDNAGNDATATLSYTVLAWTIQGFYAPVDRPDTYNLTKNGSTVPLKFEVFAGSTELIDVSDVDTFVQKTPCTAGSGGDAIEEYATGSTALRYDTTAGQFIFNWKTPKTAGVCYRVTMTTDDGSFIYANFNLK